MSEQEIIQESYERIKNLGGGHELSIVWVKRILRETIYKARKNWEAEYRSRLRDSWRTQQSAALEKAREAK